MKSQTTRRSGEQGTTHSGETRKYTSRRKKYTRQTATYFEGRRDGKPLIFGWGGHLSRKEKNQLAQRTVWTLTILVATIIVLTIVGFCINIYVIVPHKTISSVNGQNIPQIDYHKMAVYKGKDYDNQLNGVHGLIAQSNALKDQIENTKDENQKTALINQLGTLTQTAIPVFQSRYIQSAVGNEAIGWLQDDLVIRKWLSQQSQTLKNQTNPSDAAITKALNSFKAAFPKGDSYDNFLSQNKVSDDDMRAMVAVSLRRDNLQTYQASLITSPARQVKARIITVATPADAQDILKKLKAKADFAALAKEKSVDTATKSNGGDLGWLARGQYIKQYNGNMKATIDNWLFDPARKAGEISPDLSENGTEHIVQIEAIDPSRAIDDATLQTLKGNALIAWLLEQKEHYTITTPDQEMLADPANMPSFVPVTAPQQASPQGAY
jgi:hypothetical protein